MAKITSEVEITIDVTLEDDGLGALAFTDPETPPQMFRISYDALYEEIDELKIACKKGQLKSIEEEIGDCFFSLVNLARHLNISAENSVRKTNNKFSKRFKEVELKVSKMSKKINEMSTEEISKLWESVK